MSKTTSLRTYIAGLNNVDLSKVKLAGEDIANDTLRISLLDLPQWIDQGANLELILTNKEMLLLQRFFEQHFDSHGQLCPSCGTRNLNIRQNISSKSVIKFCNYCHYSIERGGTNENNSM